jgi:hypothetical protein
MLPENHDSSESTSALRRQVNMGLDENTPVPMLEYRDIDELILEDE